MRIDPANTIGPLRVNGWVSIVVFVAALAWFLWLRRNGAPVVWPDRDDDGSTTISPSGPAPESA
jgi:hypothetical protein